MCGRNKVKVAQVSTSCVVIAHMAGFTCDCFCLQNEYELTIVNTDFKIEGYFTDASSGDMLLFSIEDFDHGMGNMLLTDGHGDVLFYLLRKHDDPILVTITLLYIRSTDSLYIVSPRQFLVAQKLVEDGTHSDMDLLVSQLVPISNAEGLTYLNSVWRSYCGGTQRYSHSRVLWSH